MCLDSTSLGIDSLTSAVEYAAKIDMNSHLSSRTLNHYAML